MGAHSELTSTNAPSETAAMDGHDPSECAVFVALSEGDGIWLFTGKRLHSLRYSTDKVVVGKCCISTQMPGNADHQWKSFKRSRFGQEESFRTKLKLFM